MEEKTTILVSKDTHKKLSLFKINSNAKSIDAVIREIICKLKGELSPVKNLGEASNNKIK